MSVERMGSLSSLRRQHLLVEFSGLKQSCPEGMFVSLTPGDVTLWSGVLFVRKGPYATAVMRFQISFPDAYPRLPPLVTFSTDMFHPLVAPLSTYTYSTEIHDNGTISAGDEERLPPGGFSLRHGFPAWFSRARRSVAAAQTPPRPGRDAPTAPTTPDSRASPYVARTTPGYMSTETRTTSTYDVFRYIKSVFDDEDFLDSVPLEAAGNPSAWHAWRTHRKKQGKSFSEEGAAPDGAPKEWNWEGVWEDRVKKGIAASLSESVLYGGAGAPDEVIRFLHMDESDVDLVKVNLARTIGA